MQASIAPKIVPMSALETVMPNCVGSREKAAVSCAVAPEMTAVSNPKSNPPSAATAVLLTNEEEMFMRCIVCHNGVGGFAVRIGKPVGALWKRWNVVYDVIYVSD